MVHVLCMIGKEKFLELLFPYDSVRRIQDEMILKIDEVLTHRKHLIMHAPTGIGKTSVLGPALSHALKHKLTVFFLTSRHTQHHIAIDTLKKIREKYNIQFSVADIIGKKWMCLHPGTDKLYSQDFREYCKALLEEGKCSFYAKTKKKNLKPTVEATQLLEELMRSEPFHIEHLLQLCAKEGLCPYEISLMLASRAEVIVADYFYVFNLNIQETFFAKAKKKMEESIIIVDEAHNLPQRVRELLTEKISTFVLQRAITEAKKFHYNETMNIIKELTLILKNLSGDIHQSHETLLSKEEFIRAVDTLDDYDKLMTDLEFIGNEVREQQKLSYIGSVAAFLKAWKGDDAGFVRILAQSYYKGKEVLTLSYRCLDPSLVTKSTIEQAYSVICMSGTLTPTNMYRDLLGFPQGAIEATFKSPFPKENRLHMIVPETTTKFTSRSSSQFKDIARICAEITNLIPGNCALFFPSYSLLNEINTYFSPLCKKTTFLEISHMTKKEKHDFLENYKKYKDTGAVLMGVTSGSFGEGIDLPGDFLKSVVVVGLPLQPPDLETKELIRYYDEKFQKGWEYGYILPAVTKALQNAGRCIRDETDRGVMIFLDERYAWNNYFKCFPLDWDVKITKMYKERIKEFFDISS